MWKQWLSKEKTHSIVGTDFTSAEAAQSAAGALKSERTFMDANVRVIRPNDPEIERKLETGSDDIAGTLVRSHLLLGFWGFMIGLVAASLLVLFGVQPLVSSPVMSIGVAAAFGAIGGLLLGGLFSLRPDHDPLIQRARECTDAGRWFVLVHTRKPRELERAKELLDRFGNETMSTA